MLFRSRLASRAVACAFFAVLLSTTALAQRVPGPKLEVALTSSKQVVRPDGATGLVPADTAVPGDTIEYAARYANTGGRAIKSLTATLPVPSGSMQFIAGSTRPPANEASLDGRTYSAIPLQRKVRQPDGSEQLQPVPASEYQFLRWQLGAIEPGGAITVSARMRVVQDDTSANLLTLAK